MSVKSSLSFVEFGFSLFCCTKLSVWFIIGFSNNCSGRELLLLFVSSLCSCVVVSLTVFKIL